MRDVWLFVEDYSHAIVLKTLLARLGEVFGVSVVARELSARGGYGRVESEFEQFVRELKRSRQPVPDLVIVATDANCEGFRDRKKRMQRVAQPIADRLLFCIPDPHIERWLLLDSAAFKAVLGKGCQAPDHKCDRGRYKQLLVDAVRAAGHTPLLGGLEHAEDIVREMHLENIARRDDSFGDFFNELTSRFRQWSSQ
jgi:hypothetical protein